MKHPNCSSKLDKYFHIFLSHTRVGAVIDLAESEHIINKITACMILQSHLFVQEVQLTLRISSSLKYFDVKEIQFIVHSCGASINCPGPVSQWTRGCPYSEVIFRLFFSCSRPPSPRPPRSINPLHPPFLPPCLLLALLLTDVLRRHFHPCLWAALQDAYRSVCMCARAHVCVCSSSCTSVGCISLSQGGTKVVFHHQEKVSPI